MTDIKKLKEEEQTAASRTLPDYASPLSINENISKYLQQSFSDRIPQWIHKMFGKMAAWYAQEANARKTEKGMQTDMPDNPDLEECIKQKKQLQKDNKSLTDELKDLRTLQLCYKKMEQLNFQYADTIAKMHSKKEKGSRKDIEPKVKHQVKAETGNREPDDQNMQPNPNYHVLDDAYNPAIRKKRTQIKGVVPKLLRVTRKEPEITSSGGLNSQDTQQGNAEDQHEQGKSREQTENSGRSQSLYDHDTAHLMDSSSKDIENS
jgi:hypothetical protein